MVDVMAMAEAIVFVLGAYVAIGIVIALLFLAFGVNRIDEAAKGASPFFRPMVFAGCVAVWPFVVLRFLSLKKINQPNEEAS